MKKRFYLVFLILTIVAVVCGGCASGDSGAGKDDQTSGQGDQTSQTPQLVSEWFDVNIYNAVTNEKIVEIGRFDEDSTTLAVGKEYIFEFIYGYHYVPAIPNQVDYVDTGLRFTFDKDFIGLSERDVEDPCDHQFDVKALTATEGTELTVGLDDLSRTITITIV